MTNPHPTDFEIGREFRGNSFTLSLEQILAFAGGPLATPGWPARNLHTDATKAGDTSQSRLTVTGLEGSV